MRYSKILFFILVLTLVSCTKQKKEERMDEDKVTIEVEEILFPPQNVLQLKSYHLSSCIRVDTMDILVGYNHKLRSLDYVNMQLDSVTQIILPNEGPSAITRLSGMYAQSLDSVWVSDESERVFLINSIGEVKKIVDLKKYLGDNEQLLINTNYAMFTSHLYYNKHHHSLLFLVKDTNSNSFSIREVFVDKDKEAITYKLDSSKVIPNLTEGYTYMNFPNVSFVGEDIIYNYPVESSIYILNMNTHERNYIMADSRYTLNKVEKCTAGKDYFTLEKHRLENPHFYDVMYIPKYKMYARLHVDKVDYNEKRGVDKLLNDRDLYLMLFNEKIEKICEIKLPKHRYSPFTGWNVFYGGIILFVDNMLDEKNDTDDLTIDIISPR
jgi:hypothetical protein